MKLNKSPGRQSTMESKSPRRPQEQKQFIIKKKLKNKPIDSKAVKDLSSNNKTNDVKINNEKENASTMVKSNTSLSKKASLMKSDLNLK